MSLRRKLTDEEVKAVRFMLDYLSKHAPDSEWELNFLANVEDWMNLDGKLSDKQYSTLQGIFEKAE